MKNYFKSHVVYIYQVKACVGLGGAISTMFSCNTEVRQGEDLSPLLFAIFLNDMNESILHAYNGLKYLVP